MHARIEKSKRLQRDMLFMVICYMSMAFLAACGVYLLRTFWQVVLK